MLKPITAMTDHEMLVELMQEKRRHDRARNITYMIAGVLFVVLVVLLIRYLPPAIDYFRSLNETIEKIQGSVNQVQSVTDSLKETVGDLWDIIGGIFR